MNTTIKAITGLIVLAGAGFAGWHLLGNHQGGMDHGKHEMPSNTEGHMQGGPAVTSGDLSISGAMARFIIAGRPGAVFLTIDNKGSEDKLLSASSSMTNRVELHTHKMDGGVMKMRRIESISVTANGKTELKSGGLHIMLFNVDKLPEKGSEVPLTLTFEKAGKVDIKAIVGQPGKAMAH